MMGPDSGCVRKLQRGSLEVNASGVATIDMTGPDSYSNRSVRMTLISKPDTLVLTREEEKCP